MFDFDDFVSDYVDGFMKLAFIDEMEKISKTRGAKEIDKAINAGEMHKARHIAKAEWGGSADGKSFATGIQRTMNRQEAKAQDVHMGAGGIDPKAGGGGYAKHERMNAQRQRVDAAMSHQEAPKGPTHVINSPQHVPAPSAAPSATSQPSKVLGRIGKMSTRGKVLAGAGAAALAVGGLAAARQRQQQQE